MTTCDKSIGLFHKDRKRYAGLWFRPTVISLFHNAQQYMQNPVSGHSGIWKFTRLLYHNWCPVELLSLRFVYSYLFTVKFVDYNMHSNYLNDLSHSHSPQYDFMPGQGAQIYDSQRTILQLRKEVKIKVHWKKKLWKILSEHFF